MSNNDTFSEAIIKLFGAVVAVVVVVGGILLIESFILILLYNWFIIPFLTPAFPSGVPQLNYPIAIGILTLANMFSRIPKNDPKDTPWNQIGRALLKWGFILLTGWVAHLFM